MSINSKYTDFDLDFSMNEFTKDVAAKREANSIRQSVRNIILTRRGERKFDRTFGMGIHDLLFENRDILFLPKLNRDIEEHLEAFEPRAFLDFVEIDEDELDSNTISFTIHYFINSSIRETPQKDSLSITLEKIR